MHDASDADRFRMRTSDAIWFIKEHQQACDDVTQIRRLDRAIKYAKYFADEVGSGNPFFFKLKSTSKRAT